MKRIVVIVVRGIAATAGSGVSVVPAEDLDASPGVWQFRCRVPDLPDLAGQLDETFDDKDTPTGYWPPKPIDWTAPPKSRDALDKHTDGTGD